MEELRVPLYDRLPGIYKIRDEEQRPPGQLKAYLALVESVYGALHENIEALHDDLFIETCDDWVIPYIGDLLGVSHLTGDPWTLRADVADTISLRRRKGTLAGIERLTYNLTRWGVHAVELRENLVWNQHLNHQRPDAGGDPPYGQASVSRFTPVRGGTVTLRDAALLSLLGTPFDAFAHIVDVKPAIFGSIRYNLPNLAIFLWRLKDYRVAASKPTFQPPLDAGGVHVVRFDVHPTGSPVRLFNTYRFDPDREPPKVTALDATPGPIATARLSEGTEAGRPEQYFAVDIYDPDGQTAELDLADVGLQLHLPAGSFGGEIWPVTGSVWTVRGANLCAWEGGIQPPPGNREVFIDPVIGRIMIGVSSAAEAQALVEALLVTYTYGAVGPVGAHPAARGALPEPWTDAGVVRREVNLHENPAFGLEDALGDVHLESDPVIVEITDSLTHPLDVLNVQGRVPEAGGMNLRLDGPLLIRAADDQRPVIKLARPLRFRPLDPAQAGGLVLRLEGLYLTRDDGFPDGEPLIARAALDALELIDCTLDPGGCKVLDGTEEGARAPIVPSLRLQEPYGFADAADETAFDQTPRIILYRTVAGPLFIDGGYELVLHDTILDAGSGMGDDPETAAFALSGATGAADATWGPPATVEGVTVLGRMRTKTVSGRGGIWVHRLEVLDNQRGCIRYSYFAGKQDRLPQNLGCVEGFEKADGAFVERALLRFTDERFGEPGYSQLTHTTDFRIQERGPNDGAMGAFGFLLEAHKWRNLQIRFREFMPVGVRPLLIPVT